MNINKMYDLKSNINLLLSETKGLTIQEKCQRMFQIVTDVETRMILDYKEWSTLFDRCLELTLTLDNTEKYKYMAYFYAHKTSFLGEHCFNVGAEEINLTYTMSLLMHITHYHLNKIEYPNCLYKFFKIETDKIDMLDSIFSCFMLKHPSLYNDHFDCPIVHERGFLGKYYTVADGARISCFGEETYEEGDPVYLDPIRWVHYGDEHRGICIEYCLEGIDLPEFTTLNKINYVRTTEVVGGNTIMDDGFLKKSDAFKHEKEWRIVHFKASSLMKFFSSNDAEVIMKIKCLEGFVLEDMLLKTSRTDEIIEVKFNPSCEFEEHLEDIASAMLSNIKLNLYKVISLSVLKQHIDELLDNQVTSLVESLKSEIEEIIKLYCDRENRTLLSFKKIVADLLHRINDSIGGTSFLKLETPKFLPVDSKYINAIYMGIRCDKDIKKKCSSFAKLHPHIKLYTIDYNSSNPFKLQRRLCEIK